jgi:hypothetical protein
MFTAKDLAEESLKVTIQGNEYSTNSQTRFDLEDRTTALTITWNGTQTFDWNGRPNDADNDR